jgi:hypothetical protein
MNVINAATQYRLRKIVNIEVIRKSYDDVLVCYGRSFRRGIPLGGG